MTNPFDSILRFENGELTDPEIISLFTLLLESGDIWRLPTIYLDSAANLIAAKYVTLNQPKQLN